MTATATTEQPMVEAIGVRKVYGDNEVLKSIDMVVLPGEVVSMLGPSGSGKSTFLRCINHLEALDGGEISVNGDLVGYRRAHGKKYELKRKEIAAARRDVGMVFQRFNLFPHLTALENVMGAPVFVKGRRKDEASVAGTGAARPGRPVRQGRSLPGAAVRWSAAAGCDRSCTRHGAHADAVRRADLRARPRARR